jgi:tRNA-dihydrouridine synthase C
MRILLAPMHGIVDDVLRDILTRAGSYDACFTEFIRITGSRLPQRHFLRVSPELAHGGRTAAGTPVWVQLLGSDVRMLAEHAGALAEMGPPGIDLNFGCPAPVVNRHGGGAVLLEEPERLYEIVGAVRRALPAAMPLTAKMRLGLKDTARALDCARALEAGGAQGVTVHARTRDDRYRHPARWEWIARVRETVRVPVVGNGDIWNESDYRRCREISGCGDVMLGRGAVSDPFLVCRLRGETVEDGWFRLLTFIHDYWRQVQIKLVPTHAVGRLKHWLGYLRRRHDQADALHAEVRALRSAPEISAVLARYPGSSMSPST